MSIALLPKYSTPTDGSVLKVVDFTGQLSALNPGGWDPTGVTNPIVTEATVAEIRIKKRTSSGDFGPETTVNVYDDLPLDDGGFIEITAEDLGQGGSISDGVYLITYMVQGVWVTNGSTPFLATKEVYVPLVPNICACWQKQALSAAACKCNCDKIDEKLNSISYYVRLLEGAYTSGDPNSMQKFVDILTKLCDCCPK
jgi:hypothetical protein